jgi:GntR family transcriptional regulator
MPAHCAIVPRPPDQPRLPVEMLGGLHDQYGFRTVPRQVEALYDANVASTRSIVEIDHSSLIPLHEQVAAAIRRAIADGEVRSGERLPPARDLAAVLGVNANTVFRGLRTLRDEGIVEFRRGRGVTVSGVGPERGAVVAKARELVALARRCGYRPEELAEIISQVS